MTTEVSVTINDLGNVTCSSGDSEISSDLILKSPSTYISVFQDPDDLRKVFESSTHENTELRSQMRRMRLKILHPISSAPLTPEEENGSVDGPNLSRLTQSWRSASQAIPRGHGIEEIIFDMSCGQNVEIRQIVRLLQYISTTVSLKTKGPFRCEVQGCSPDRKEWLECSLVSV